MPENDLSERELEILRLVATGASNKEIAQKLYISSNTVKVHLRNIFSKTGAASRTEAAMYAVQEGLAPSGMGAIVTTEAEDDIITIDELPGEQPGVRRIPAWAWIVTGLIVVIAIVLGARAWLVPESPGQGSLVVPSDLPRWQALAEMPLARRGLAAVAYENQIYAIGGENQEGISGQVQRFALDTNTWQELASKPTPVSDIRAVVIGGKIYIPGGRQASGEPSRAFEIYDPRENQWSQAAQLPRGLSGYALAAFEGKLFLFGGWDGKAYSQEVYQYDPGLDAWEARTPMPTARAFAAAATAGDRIYVIGGEGASGVLPVNEIYLPVLDGSSESPWLYGPALPQGRAGLGVVSFSDFIYVIGGRGAETDALPSLQYFSQQEAWQSFDAPFPRAWSDFGLAAAGSQIYVLGGKAGDQLLANMMVYQAVFTVSIPFLSGEQ